MKKIAKLDAMSQNCILDYTGEVKWECSYKESTFVVDLEKKTCGCKQWDVSGIPCFHAFAAINKNNLSKVDFVSPYLLRDSYLKAYANMIAPLPDSRQWPDSGRGQILPPGYKALPGRPKISRRKGPDEPNNKNRI